MKRTILAMTACCWLAGSLTASAQHRGVHVAVEYNGDKAARGEQLADIFVRHMSEAVEDEFPCLHVTSLKKVRELLLAARDISLVSAPGAEETMARIGRWFCGDFLIKLVMTEVGAATQIHAFAMHMGHPEGFAEDMTFASTNRSAGEMEAFAKAFAKELTRGLAQFQPCAYSGTVTITVKRTTDINTIRNSPVSCNGREAVRQQSSKTTGTEDTVWKLNRYGNSMVNGDMEYRVMSRREETDRNPCYSCTFSQGQGDRTYSSVTQYGGVIKGLSDFVNGETDEKVTHVRVTLRFTGDNQYFLQVAGSSKTVEMTEVTRERADGTCDTLPPASKESTHTVSVPIPEEFGPFQGSPLDKVLKCSTGLPCAANERPHSKDQKGEKTVTTIDFELTRSKYK